MSTFSNSLSRNSDLRGISDDAVGQELERSVWRVIKERSIIAVVLHNQGALEFFFLKKGRSWDGVWLQRALRDLPMA